MWEYEFDQEVYDRVLREEGEEIGMRKATHVYQQIQSGNKDNKTIAEVCGCSVEMVGELRRQFGF